jgi:hypothetical protein
LVWSCRGWRPSIVEYHELGTACGISRVILLYMWNILDQAWNSPNPGLETRTFGPSRYVSRYVCVLVRAWTSTRGHQKGCLTPRSKVIECRIWDSGGQGFLTSRPRNSHIGPHPSLALCTRSLSGGTEALTTSFQLGLMG